MRSEIEQKLSVIQGLQIWAVGHAANMLWLQIGDRYVVPAWRGGTKEVGTYALHIDCPWTWARNGTTLANQETETQRLNVRITLPVFCQRVVVKDSGSFEIHLDDQSKFSVIVEDDPDQNAVEFWRFFQPSRNERHFVVGSGGIVK
jgi:hypothetical protein